MAIGSQAATTRSNQIALGTNTTEVTVPNIAGNADQLISANADGTLQRTNISTSDVASLVSNKASNAFDQSIIQVEVGNTNGSTTSSVSIGAGACAQFAGSTAIGAKAKTTRTNQVVVGNRKTTTTIPNIAGNGNGMVIANSDGTLARSTINLNNLALLTNGSTPMSTGVASNTEGRIQIGKNTTTKGENAVAIGADSKAVGRNAMAVGAGAISLEDNLITIGSEQTKTRITNLSGEGNQIILANPSGTLIRYTGSKTVDSDLKINGDQTITGNQTIEGNQEIQGNLKTSGSVKFEGLASSGQFTTDQDQNDGEKRLLTLDGDGNAGTSNISLDQIERAVTNKIPQIEESIGDLGRAVETTGAMAAAFSAIPEMTLDPEEPVRCGFGGGGFGTQYAIAGGCAVRIAHRFHLNGALAYAPSIDYNYGATPSISGRLGLSFPLGKRSLHTRSLQIKKEFAAYQSSVEMKIAMLQTDINKRDDQITALRKQLEALSEANGQKTTTEAPASDATNALIAALRQRIEELESQKEASVNDNQEQQRILKNQATEIKNQRQEIEQMKSQILFLMKHMPNNNTTFSSDQLKTSE